MSAAPPLPTQKTPGWEFTDLSELDLDAYAPAEGGDAEARARQGACIAVPGAVVAEAHERYTRMMVGRPHLPEVWARRIFAGG